MGLEILDTGRRHILRGRGTRHLRADNRQSGASQVVLVVKNLPAKAGDTRDMGLIPGSGNPLEEGTATHSSILAWRITWTEKHGGVQTIGSQRVRHDWSDLACMHTRGNMNRDVGDTYRGLITPRGGEGFFWAGVGRILIKALSHHELENTCRDDRKTLHLSQLWEHQKSPHCPGNDL